MLVLSARLLRAHVTDAYLEREVIVCMDWPARSSDLNPIEHAWDMLQPDLCSQGLYRNSRMPWLLNGDSFHKTGYGL